MQVAELDQDQQRIYGLGLMVKVLADMKVDTVALARCPECESIVPRDPEVGVVAVCGWCGLDFNAIDH